MIGYLQSFQLVWKSCKTEWELRGPSQSDNFLVEFLVELKENLCLQLSDLFCCLLIALLFTIIRKQLAAHVLEPLGKSLKFTLKNQHTFPESSFKFLVYLAFFTTECVLVFSRYPEFLTDPKSCWTGWGVGMKVQPDLYWIYIAETGFYIHGIYATLFLDTWRDDSIVMLLHHCLTISLIVFSLALRYHRIGLVVLFLHDIADVCLEFTKVSKCFQEIEGKKSSIFGTFTAAGFLVFASAWIGCRLYWYPILVLYSTGVVARSVLPDAPFYFFFNGMLWMLFVMNIWWAYFIVLLIYRILTGKSKHVEDTRELNIEKVKEKKANVVSNGRAVLSNGESRKTMHQENGDGSSGDEIVKDYVIVNGDKNRNSKTNGMNGNISHSNDKEACTSNSIRKRN